MLGAWLSTYKKRTRSHTQTHDKNITTNDHSKDHRPHLTTIEGGAATVRTTSHIRVGVKRHTGGGGPARKAAIGSRR